MRDSVPSSKGLDQGTKFCEGHELDRHSAALVPDDAIGRMLSPEEAGKIIRQIERGIPSEQQRPQSSDANLCGPEAKR